MCESGFIQAVLITSIMAAVISVLRSTPRSFRTGGDKDELRILMIGKTGAGKSTTGNAILGRKAFVAKVSFESVTKQIEIAHAYRFDRKVVVYDTPGLFNTKKSPDEVMTDIGFSTALDPYGVNVILIVLEIGRFTPEEQKTVDIFLDYFGENALKYVTVAFTGKEYLDKENITIENFVKTRIEESSSLNFLLNKIDHRYVSLGLPDQNLSNFIESMTQKTKVTKDMHLIYPMFLDYVDQDINKLHSVMNRLLQTNKNECYTFEMFKSAFKALLDKRRFEELIKQRQKDAEIQKIKDAEEMKLLQNMAVIRQQMEEEQKEFERKKRKYQ